VAGVEVVGQVPDVRPYVAGAAVAVVPLRIARGLQNKVLEAMALGKPVVASPPALAALRHQGDLPALSAEGPPEWVDHVVRLLDDAALRQELGAAGRRFVEAHHDWERCLEQFGDLLGLPTTPRCEQSREMLATLRRSVSAPASSLPLHASAKRG
jgi:glycosyltransferase involved in cell wall biosynthesis